MNIIIKDNNDQVLFNSSKNTIKEAVIEALESNADLRNANLRNANLRGADLRNADLYGANLRGANLRFADLRDADLSFADLRDADLSFADLYGANLRGADLSFADLRGADLSFADLYGANLRGADLSFADLRDLKGSNQEITLIKVRTQIVPQSGSFVGWKKLSNGTIAKLQITEDALRVGGLLGRKCRASKVIVLEGEGDSLYNNNKFKYTVGQTLSVPDFDPSIQIECGPGIHFFLSKEEAENY